MAKRTKMPTDLNQRAKAIVDLATRDEPAEADDGEYPAAVELGRLGGAKGGKASREADRGAAIGASAPR